MPKSLVIVESPAKAKTINRYLGKNYVVKSSVGHVRDLPVSGNKKKVDPKERAKAAAITRKMSPEQKIIHQRKKAKEQMVFRMGIDPENGWTADYKILPGKEKVLEDLQKLAETADVVYLATDLDREGEAIAWHLRETIGGDSHHFKRVVFNEITKKAITEAFVAPGELDMDKVNAQQARRFLDRVVGFMLSPLLWAKVARGLSAGRVQSVAVRLIVEREHEIKTFIPEEYWEIKAHLHSRENEEQKAVFQVSKENGKSFSCSSKSKADAVLNSLKAGTFTVVKREDKPQKTRPKPPFITSTLQQAASTRLNYSVKKTMLLAQRLYEAGYITYMRTDSLNLSVEAVDACRDYIKKNYGDRYIPENAVRYTSKEGAQEAHEAIRPSDVNQISVSLVGMDEDAKKLYNLIRNQFLACQMPAAEYLGTTVTVKNGDFDLRTRGRVIVFDGFTRVMPPMAKKDEDQTLPDFSIDEILNLIKLDPTQHFTKPSPRYTEASLVRELEKRGIGRPSTYANIISTIQDRGYVKLENRRFYAQKIADIVTDRLISRFEDIMDYNFTAGMEQSLDDVASGNRDWKNLLDEFYIDFVKRLDDAHREDAGMKPNDPTDTDVLCPKCGRHMQIRTGSTGVFLGCSGYALPPKERCKATINLIPGEEAVSVGDEEGESLILRQMHRCKICDTRMDSYLMDEDRKLHICGNNPDCPGFEVEHGKFKIKGYDGPVIECEKCGGEMQLKSGRFGKYFGCTNEECTNTRKLLKNGEAAPPRMDPVPCPELHCRKVDDYYLLRDGAAGLFLAASNFPKNRETRTPLVEELLAHKDEIDPKYSYLFSAPVEDPEGNKTQIRFSRKSKEQYIISEKDEKATGWKLWYRDGKWIEDKELKAKEKLTKK